MLSVQQPHAAPFFFFFFSLLSLFSLFIVKFVTYDLGQDLDIFLPSVWLAIVCLGFPLLDKFSAYILVFLHVYFFNC